MKVSNQCLQEGGLVREGRWGVRFGGEMKKLIHEWAQQQ